MFLGILIFIAIAAVYFWLPLVLPSCLFFYGLAWAITKPHKILLQIYGIIFLVFLSASLWGSFSVYMLKKEHEGLAIGRIEHAQSVRLVLPPEKDLVCDDFCLKLLDYGHFERLIIEAGPDSRQAYKLGRGADCMSRLQRLTRQYMSNREDKSWALSLDITNYTQRRDICAIRVADNDEYQASIYLDKLPRMAPWIKQEGHTVLITQGQNSAERTISEAYQTSYSYPARIPVPYISCITSGRIGWGPIGCVRREFKFVSRESNIWQPEMGHLIADTFGFSNQPAENPNEAIANYNDVKSLLLDGLSQKEFESVSTTLLYYARKNTFFPDETL